MRVRMAFFFFLELASSRSCLDLQMRQLAKTFPMVTEKNGRRPSVFSRAFQVPRQAPAPGSTC